MGATIDRERANDDLCERIDRVARELPHMGTSMLAFAIDDIRRIAARSGHRAVAELARGLEHSLSASSASVIVLPFLEAMRDAVGSESVDPHVAQAFLASVELRIHG